MTNTPFSNQVDIVADYYFYADADPDWLMTFDLGGPLAFAVQNGGVDADNLSDKGKEWITQAFTALLNVLGVDSYGQYDSLEEIVSISEQG